MEELEDDAPLPLSMGDVAADFEETDTERDDAEHGLLGEVAVGEESWFFRTCVFACSDVAASASRVKVTNRNLYSFPRLGGLTPSPELLTVLDLSRNALSLLPAAVGQLVGLRRLLLDHNRIATVDPALYGLTQLTHLTLSHNRLSFLHREVLDLDQLQQLDLSHNPLGWPPAALSAQGLRSWARKYKAPPTYRTLPDANTYLDASLHCVYYLGPGDKDEDRHELAVPLAEDVPAPRRHDPSVLRRAEHMYVGIYDGHCGHMVSTALQQNFYKKLGEGGCFAASATDEELRARIKSVYLETDRKLCDILRGEKTSKKRKPGSCCTAVWIVGTRLVVSHVGDSRVVMCGANGSVEELAPDHHPDAPGERRRVEGRGGIITYRGCWRVYSPEEGMYLAVSRAFGDICLKEPKLVIDADPDVTIREITPNDRWLVIASDGLWCRVDNEPCAALLNNCDTAQEATDRLISEAKFQKTHDNTTVCVVKLNMGTF